MTVEVKPFSEWTDKELMDNAKELHVSIHNIGCFGTKDLLWYEGICRELEKRGYEIQEESCLKINKGEEDEEKDES